MRRGAMQSFTDGYQMGRQMYQDYENAQIRQGLSDAAQQNQVSEDVVGEDAAAKADEVKGLSQEAFNNARDKALADNPDNPQAAEEAGLAAAQKYQPAIDELQRKASSDKPRYNVGAKAYDSKGEADYAAKSMNQAGMADVYRKHGRPEQAEILNQRSMQTEAAGLALKNAKREDQLGEKTQPLKMGLADDQYGAMKQEIRNKLAAGTITYADAQVTALDHFAKAAESNPMQANRYLKDPEFQKLMGFQDAEFKPGTKDGLIVTDRNGVKHETTVSALKARADLKVQNLSEGGMLVGVDGKGNTKVLASNPKAADPSKNDAQMDDAAKVMDRFLEANKTMMTQFGGKEQEVRQQAVLNHAKGIGEFKRRTGRAPTQEEAAIIAEGAFKRASQQ